MTEDQQPDYRGFTVPGGKDTDWDPEIHGVETDDDCPADFAIISWRPGYYSYSAGSGGSSFDFNVPEDRSAHLPQQGVLRGIHEFLKYAHDE